MEKFKSLAWYLQLLMLVVVGALLYTGVWYFVTSGTRTEIDELNQQVSQLQSKNQAAQIATQRINEFRSLFASKTAEYDELKVLLPEEREITNVLSGLQDTARGSRLSVMRFSPRDDAQQEGFMAKPVEVEVDSNFNNLREFFDQMAKLQRIVSISDFSLKQLPKQVGDKTLHAQFLLTAYYAAPENQVPIDPKTGKPLPAVDPKTGKPLPAVDPKTGKPVPPAPNGKTPPAAPPAQQPAAK